MSDRSVAHPIHVRKLETPGEYAECVRLQQETWGKRFPDLVPPSILLVSQKIGGLVVGAFDEAGTLVGFAFALAGIKDGERILWSDMLAVRSKWRGCGIGSLLKRVQREEALNKGIARIQWTFDPLVARNARFNLVRLGARVESYAPDMYEEGEGDLHRGLGMDRFIMLWDLNSPAARAFAEGKSLIPASWPPEAPVVNTELQPDGRCMPVVRDLPEVSRVMVEIPADIHAIRNASSAEAALWRRCTRRAFEHYLSCGYRIEYLSQEGHDRCCYLLVSGRPRK